MKRIITFGTFDLLHEGHIQLLERAKALGAKLIVGISTDRLNAIKGKVSIFPQEQRLSYISALSCVDEVFLEEKLEEKDQYIRTYSADLLVMGEDWKGRFDSVSCEVAYLTRTKTVSSSAFKTELDAKFRCRKVLFGDTYIQKHYDCALTIVNAMGNRNVIPILTNSKFLTGAIDCDCLVYFNKPVNDPPLAYYNKPRILIDHGASTLKWFLASQARFAFFDKILTAGADHTESLLSFFPGHTKETDKVKTAGFIKSEKLFDPPRYTREEIAKMYSLDASQPIILFAPTWHIFSNRDISDAIIEIAKIENEVTSLHPETAHLDTRNLNVVKNLGGITLELLKHADCVISDTSSTLFEAAALGKPTVQLLLREYSDNNAILFDFPYVAGTCDLFCAGITAKPADVYSAVQVALSNSDTYNSALKRMQSRLLRGTHISPIAGDAIVDELVKACDTERLESTDSASQLASARSLTGVHENLFFAKNKIIGHSGGNFNGHHASNSLESIQAASKSLDIVEINLVLGKDGVLVAHDGSEDKFGLSSRFAATSVANFLESKFNNALTPVRLETALEICARKGKAIVCDIKSVGGDYEKICQALYAAASQCGVLSRTIIQCYNIDDFELVHALGFQRAILAVWKNYYCNPFGDEVLEFIDHCIDTNSRIIVGISIPYQNKHMAVPAHLDDRLTALFAYWKRLYLHGAPVGKYSEILRKNIGVFADSYSAEFEFQNHPVGFDWEQYLFLNRALVDHRVDNQITATVHFLNHGKTEGRLFRYEVPSGFVWTKYIEKNARLRKEGIGCLNSASAHWTRYGSNENRPY